MIERELHPQLVPGLQRENKSWWTRHPMSYDWHGSNGYEEGTPEFFQEIDRRFFNSSPLFSGSQPFARFIPFQDLKGKRVLEIGCGLGSHSQLLAEAGCELSSIDLTSRAVALTKRRLEMKNLAGDVCEMDGENMNFPEDEFDFVWSWGVIHHSAHTDRIVREVARVLKPGGEFRLMVYNRKAFDSYVKLMRGLASGKFFSGMSKDEVLSYYTDGFIARFYDRSSLKRLLEDNGLRLVATSPLGQTSELLPIPGVGVVGRIKYGLVSKIPDSVAIPLLRRTGSFLFGVAVKPEHISLTPPCSPCVCG